MASFNQDIRYVAKIYLNTSQGGVGGHGLCRAGERLDDWLCTTRLKILMNRANLGLKPNDRLPAPFDKAYLPANLTSC